MRVSDNRYERDMRKHNLAKWMISQGARTHTITRWTGLSRYRVQALSRRYQQTAPGDHRRRGISPSQVEYFGRSAAVELDTLVLAFIALEMKVIPVQVVPDARSSLPELARGERLRDAFEWYRRLVPATQISLERAILFITQFAERRSLSLRRCSTCPNVMIVDRQVVQQRQCPICRTGRRTESTPIEE